MRYPADPPAVEEIGAVMRVAGETGHGLRTRALIVVLWRAGVRISEALALAESDLDRSRGSVLVRRGKGGAPSPLARASAGDSRRTSFDTRTPSWSTGPRWA
ncbi:tyrosine-type recombinase/integrase [Capillimicrobium parvum]|uniref:tyrosine-type recombinase/integrase n=1 Tax=Capillimicrobium parvum TaxID=2884022 RepID=UPI00216B0A35|nr:tyrosine-type recombinase/integrase [Capillimicrobium parvum]